MSRRETIHGMKEKIWFYAARNQLRQAMRKALIELSLLWKRHLRVMTSSSSRKVLVAFIKLCLNFMNLELP